MGVEVDSGTADAGAGDGGMLDASMPDAGMPDGGTDSGDDAGDPCMPSPCDANASCEVTGGAAACTCNPGYAGDGMTCVEVATGLTGLRWELPCTDASSPACACTPNVMFDATLMGDTSVTYNITLHFRGVVEQKTYSGGTADGMWYVGGSFDAGDPYNTYSLTISDPPQTYYLNAGTSAIEHCWPLDYTQTVQAQGGAMVTLFADAKDDREITNIDETGTPIVIPDVPPAPDPYDGQFIQMDVVSVEAP